MDNAKSSRQKLSERRMIENEVIFRRVNEGVKEFIESERFINSNIPQPFYCECSNPNCTERIKLTPAQYEELHTSKKLFVTVRGHEFPEVEAVISKKSNLQVVEKYDTPPTSKAINLALKSIKI